jgi:hypothetical protein
MEDRPALDALQGVLVLREVHIAEEEARQYLTHFLNNTSP